MNNGNYEVRLGNVVSAPEARDAGGKALVTLRVALNTYGEKAKARYREALFVDGTFSGRDAEQALALQPGDRVAFSGVLGIRDYTTKAGEARQALEIPFARDLIIITRKEEQPKVAEPKAVARSTKQPPVEDDPFAGL